MGHAHTDTHTNAHPDPQQAITINNSQSHTYAHTVKYLFFQAPCMIYLQKQPPRQNRQRPYPQDSGLCTLQGNYSRRRSRNLNQTSAKGPPAECHLQKNATSSERPRGEQTQGPDQGQATTLSNYPKQTTPQKPTKERAACHLVARADVFIARTTTSSQ